ncbi:unnamed protein product [Agarophyton chilense]
MGALLTGTVIFLILGLISYFIVSAIYRNDKDAQALGQLSVVLATVCMYIMWATCYLHQLHPLVRPIKGMH